MNAASTAEIDDAVRTEIVETVRKFVTKEVIPVASELERTDSFPAEIVERCATSACSGSPSLRRTADSASTCSPTSPLLRNWPTAG